MSRFLAALGLALVLPTLAHAADTYKIDKVHSSVLFKAKHLGASYLYGAFTDVAGTITVDTANPAGSAIDLTIKTDSITTHDETRDKHLKSPDFFNAKQFPTITFKSKSVTKVDDKTSTVVGDLTLHGVTKPVTAKVSYVGTGKDPQGNTLIGYEASLTIKRSDFGITYWVPAIDDEVPLIIAIEANNKK